jgi:hypothetical protein
VFKCSSFASGCDGAQASAAGRSGGTQAAIIRNSILWDTGATFPAPIHHEAGNAPTVEYGHVQGGWPESTNTNSDPLLEDPAAANYRSRCDLALPNHGEGLIPSDSFDVDDGNDFGEPIPDLDRAEREAPCTNPAVDLGA